MLAPSTFSSTGFPGVPGVLLKSIQIPTCSQDLPKPLKCSPRSPKTSHMRSSRSLFELLGAPGPPKTMFSLSKTMVFKVSTKPLLEVFCALFGHPRPPFGHPKAAISFPKDAQSSPQAPQGHQKDDKIYEKSTPGPSGAPLAPKRSPKHQNYSKRYPKSLQKVPKMTPKDTQNDPTSLASPASLPSPTSPASHSFNSLNLTVIHQ